MPEKIHTKFDDPRRITAPEAANKPRINGAANGKKRTAKEAFHEATVTPAGHLKRRAAELLPARKQLPIFAHKSEIDSAPVKERKVYSTRTSPEIDERAFLTWKKEPFASEMPLTAP